MLYNRSNNQTVSPKTHYNTIEQAILTTVLYSDIFHFPLTEKELWKYLVISKPISRTAFLSAISTLLAKQHSVLVFQHGYYCLRGHESVIVKRKANQSEVVKKMLLAQKAVSVLASLPTISFIGLSGGLAVENVTAEDDIDLFIIVKKGTVFRSRFWILVLLQLMGIRRSRGSVHAANTICINLLIDETEMQWSEQKRDLYIAHEIAQVVPLFDRGGIFQSFCNANQWILQYLPHSFAPKSSAKIQQKNNKKTRIMMNFFETIIPSERVFRFFQLLLIRRHQTRETVTNSHLAFHPKDYGANSLHDLKLKMRQLGLLTKF